MAGKVITNRVRANLTALERRQGKRRRTESADIMTDLIEVLLRRGSSNLTLGVAGRLAHQAGRIPRRLYAHASSPAEGQVATAAP